MKKIFLLSVASLLYLGYWYSIVLIEKSFWWLLPIFIIGVVIIPQTAVSIVFEYLIAWTRITPSNMFMPIRSAYQLRTTIGLGIVLGVVVYIVLLIIDWQRFISFGLMILMMLLQVRLHYKACFFLWKKNLRGSGLSDVNMLTMFDLVVVKNSPDDVLRKVNLTNEE